MVIIQQEISILLSSEGRVRGSCSHNLGTPILSLTSYESAVVLQLVPQLVPVKKTILLGSYQEEWKLLYQVKLSYQTHISCRGSTEHCTGIFAAENILAAIKLKGIIHLCRNTACKGKPKSQFRSSKQNK
jgi:hypothetical protein